MRSVPILLFIVLAAAAGPVHAQGALEPTAPPAPVMKTLDQVEPRSPISSAGTIAAPGSYYLTNDIDGRLTIAADDVDLDLRGFTITGTGTFSVEIDSVENVRLHGGTVRGSTSAPIRVAASSHVLLENLRVLDAAFNAVQVNDHSGLLVIRSIVVDTSGFAGIRVINTQAESVEAVIEDNIVTNANTIDTNVRPAISLVHTGAGALTAAVSRNRVFGNRTTGIAVLAEGGGTSGGIVSGNTIHDNGGTGLFVDGDFIVSKNIAHDNVINYDLAGAPNAAPVSTLASAGAWDNVGQ